MCSSNSRVEREKTEASRFPIHPRQVPRLLSRGPYLPSRFQERRQPRTVPHVWHVESASPPLRDFLVFLPAEDQSVRETFRHPSGARSCVSRLSTLRRHQRPPTRKGLLPRQATRLCKNADQPRALTACRSGSRHSLHVGFASPLEARPRP